jgi:hypothetical protein
MSYYISTKYPKKFKYILNDNNKYLIEILNIAKDENKLIEFEKNINEIAQTITTKDIYLSIVKQDNLMGYYIMSKITSFRPGLYNLNYKYKYIDLINCPIVNFLRTENIEICNIDAVNIIEKYKNNKKAFILLDPPYLQSENSFYKCPTLNIYEYLSYNPIKKYKSNLILILENNWIIKLLFKEYNKIEYNKKYKTTKKQTTHLLIMNK